MDPHRLLNEVIAHAPQASCAEVLRLAMLLCHHQSAAPSHESPDSTAAVLQKLQHQIAMYDDQHAAIAWELDTLASTEPCQFQIQQLWTLIRAIRVQSQLLEFYMGPQALPVASAQPIG